MDLLVGVVGVEAQVLGHVCLQFVLGSIGQRVVKDAIAKNGPVGSKAVFMQAVFFLLKKRLEPVRRRSTAVLCAILPPPPNKEPGFMPGFLFGILNNDSNIRPPERKLNKQLSQSIGGASPE